MTAVSGDRLVQGDSDVSHNPWVLMTRMPWVPISILNVGGEVMICLARDLADHDAPSDVELPETIHESPPELVIRGVLRDNIKVLEPMTSLKHYYGVKIREKGPAGGNSQEEGFVFTHYDLSPRTVLTSGTPAQITGIVDFKFARFMSPIEELLDDHVQNDGHWSKPVYNAYLEGLENNGIATPTHGIADQHWLQALWLEQLIQIIDPWWLSRKYEGEELRSELDKTHMIV
ncbi:putative Kinase [Seiridium cardinale]